MQQNMNLSMAPYTQAGAFVCSQYDVGRTCQIKLTDDSGDYAIPTGATVTVMATKPSGLGFAVACTWSGSTVTVVTTETMTNEFGRFPAEIRVTSGDTVLGTTNFFFKVERSPHPEGTVDGDAETIINQITLLVNRAEAAADAAVEDAQETIDEILETIPQDIADLKADIDELQQGGGGLTVDIKTALLNCFENVVWKDDDPSGRTYYDALEDALYPPADLVSISALYTQSGTVYNTDTLDSLKTDLVVTALYDDSTTETVTTYTLSGTLSVGTSTITVAYGGKTDTFSVTVTKASDVPTGYTQYDYLTTTNTTGDYVDTGLVASDFGLNSFAELSTYFRIKMTSLPSAEANILGCRAVSNGTGSTGNYQFYVETSGGVYWYLLGAGAESTEKLQAGDIAEVSYVFNDGAMSTVSINDGTADNVANVSKSSVIVNGKALILYGTNRNGVKQVGSTQVDVMELGNVELKNASGTTILKFIPAYSEADTKYGFYEKIQGVFYGCANGTLTGGNWS